MILYCLVPMNMQNILISIGCTIYLSIYQSKLLLTISHLLKSSHSQKLFINFDNIVILMWSTKMMKFRYGYRPFVNKTRTQFCIKVYCKPRMNHDCRSIFQNILPQQRISFTYYFLFVKIHKRKKYVIIIIR